MSNDDVDQKRRDFLLKVTVAMSAAGAVAAGIPFVAALQPSEREKALGGPITFKVGQMKPGDQVTVMWRGKPIWNVRRDKNVLDKLPSLNYLLRDPNSEIEQQPPYAHNLYRSRNPEFLVLVGVCTHLGCTPTYRPEPHSIDASWPGGFFCTCHGSKFDLAGRVFKGVPAPVNLEVPPYVFADADTLIIGVDKPEEIK